MKQRKVHNGGVTGGGGRGLYGRDVGAHLARAGVGEFIGTWILVYVGTAVACAAALEKPVAGLPYDSLAVALGFGMALVVIVAALAHTTGAHVNPAVGQFSGLPVYLIGPVVGGVIAAFVYDRFVGKAEAP